jgi:hypothetical protein
MQPDTDTAVLELRGHLDVVPHQRLVKAARVHKVAHAQERLGDAKRLGEEVRRAGSEGALLRVLGDVSGEDNDGQEDVGSGGEPADLSEELKPSGAGMCRSRSTMSGSKSFTRLITSEQSVMPSINFTPVFLNRLLRNCSSSRHHHQQ